MRKLSSTENTLQKLEQDSTCQHELRKVGKTNIVFKINRKLKGGKRVKLLYIAYATVCMWNGYNMIQYADKARNIKMVFLK